MAPIYSFTCDEIWRHLPPSLDRTESVHLAHFVAAEQLIQGLSQAALARLKNWEQLIEVRSEVLKILERARKDKFIGDSLQAKVKLNSASKYRELLRTYEGFLPTLFIVSQVEIEENLPAETYFHQTDDLNVLVLRADGAKCERCWNYSTDVGKDKDFETVCLKCSAALKEMTP